MPLPPRCRWWPRCSSISRTICPKSWPWPMWQRCLASRPTISASCLAKYGDAGFVEYITETRIAAAKRLLEKGIRRYTRSHRNWALKARFTFPRCSKGHGPQPAGISAEPVSFAPIMKEGVTLWSRNVYRTCRIFCRITVPARQLPSGSFGRHCLPSAQERWCKAGKMPLRSPLPPAADGLAGFYTHRTAHRLEDAYFSPPGPAVRFGAGRVCPAQRTLSGTGAGYAVGHL